MKKIEEIRRGRRRRRREGGRRAFRVCFFLVFVNGTNSREDTLSYLPIGFSRGSWVDGNMICDPFTALGMICMYSEIRCHCHHFTC